MDSFTGRSFGRYQGCDLNGIIIRKDERNFSHSIPLKELRKLGYEGFAKPIIDLEDLPLEIRQTLVNAPTRVVRDLVINAEIQSRRIQVMNQVTFDSRVRKMPELVRSQLKDILFNLRDHIPLVPSRIVASHFQRDSDEDPPIMWLSARDDKLRFKKPSFVWVSQIGTTLSYGLTEGGTDSVPSSSILSHWTYHLCKGVNSFLLHYHPARLVREVETNSNLFNRQLRIVSSRLDSRSSRFGKLLFLALEQYEGVVQKGHGLWVGGTSSHEVSKNSLIWETSIQDQYAFV
ncbi:MAG: hypothetical protein E6230_16225 [Paenibacillus dendritiformis]|uniref:hypothetical protein n=1 Tax=uncultured Paenibacillus sp. TaxID=227322 RepID=UPI0025DAC8DF|nr:hypothetical protein [uncultured Paenibacillus sp.]MDU5143722.1 hypothetical protein [Paenibacillus dendritiformis]